MPILKMKVNTRQIWLLNFLDAGPRSSSFVWSKMRKKKDSYPTVDATQKALCRLENRGLVRSRGHNDRISWELTAKGRKAVSK